MPHNGPHDYGQASQKPDFELRRKIQPGTYRIYATVYFRPLRVWVNGKWIIGRKAVYRNARQRARR